MGITKNTEEGMMQDFRMEWMFPRYHRSGRAEKIEGVGRGTESNSATSLVLLLVNKV